MIERGGGGEDRESISSKVVVADEVERVARRSDF